jgi:MerR family transcriptional regulator, light-induced transcriptional regulator
MPGHAVSCNYCVAVGRVVTGGHSVSATRFAALTGVSRERLRTWERRYGYPIPLRVGQGPRRYALDDIQRVVAVRRAAEAGVPIPRAIAITGPDAAPDPLSADTFAALVDHAPVPVAALSGPAPLRIEFVNAAVRALPAAPRPRQELAEALPEFRDSACARTLQQLFVADAGPVEVEHPAWDGEPGHNARSTLFGLPVAPGAMPLVAMVGIEGERERAARSAVDRLRAEVTRLHTQEARHTRWLDAIAGVAEEFRREPTRAAIDNGLDLLVRQTNAMDGAVALYVSGALVVSGSRRGLLGQARVTVAAHPELARGLRDAAPTWLDPVAAAAFGVPRDLYASATPIVVAGEPLGLLVFLFAEVEPHDDDNGRLLAAISAAMGFALLRDRLAEALREAAGSARDR